MTKHESCITVSETIQQANKLLPPWIANPFRLISLLEMQKFFAHHFVKLSRALEAAVRLPLAAKYANISPDTSISDDVHAQYSQFIEACLVASAKIGLRVSLASIKKVKEESETSRPSYNRIREMAQHLQTTIESEMSTQLFMHVDSLDARYYQDNNLFGLKVMAKFPRMSYDIEEAGKCFATNRYTACVFHLMRIMEIAVQLFGKKLKVKLTEIKAWQNILDETNKPIKAMKAKTTRQKAKQGAYAEAAAHLFNVKVAWRNRVMHPKDQYNGEEARDIFNHVEAFIRQLAKIL